MKKISILSACVLMGVSAFGQANVVKEAENAQKKGEPYAEVVKIITPAMTNPETSNDANTYMVPGKAGYATYDKMYELNALGQLPAGGEKTRSEALMGGYEYMLKALALDTVTDAKGKVKTKFSKDIVKTVGGHFNDYNIVAVDFWNAQDWDNAYLAWDIYCNMPSDPRFAKAIPVVPADTTLAEIMYNRSLAAYQTGDMKKTVASFLQAKDKGYHKKSLYDYAIAAAYAAEDAATVEALCREALPLYGAEDSRYIGQLINTYLEKKDYAGALAMINDAIATDPSNGQYHVIRGIIYEQDNSGDPKAEFKAAVEADPNNAMAQYHYGRMIYNEGVKANDEAPTDPQEYAKAKKLNVDPLMQEAAVYLEKAWEIDNDYKDPLTILYQVYYILGDESNMKYTEDRQKY